MALNRASMYTVLPLISRYIRLQEEGRAARNMRRQIRVIRRRRARQREIILLVLLMGLAFISPTPRSIWTRERSSNWWERIVLETFGPHDWVENFRMKKDTFLLICEKVRPVIRRQNTKFRRAISVEKRVAITLWCLATPCEYRTLSHLFGVARSTVCTILHETCAAIATALMCTYIKFPTGQSLQNVIEGFELKWGFPQCMGAIDGSHIPICAPELNHTDYYNRKGWYSMVVQAVVDHDYLFRDICVGWPVSVHDARIFINSLLYKRISEEGILDGHDRNLLGCRIPACIIADAAYPIQTWLLKPFADTPSLTPQQKCFNYRLSRARMVVENAFGRLKGRWRRLLKRNDMTTEHIPTVIAVCCVLHNICEIHGEGFNDAWLQEETDYQQPYPSSFGSASNNETAHSVRNTLMHYLFAQQ